jgi:diphosphomevalonate decarboxylase
MFKNPELKFDQKTDSFDNVTWKSPSNIALIKYWGKREFQLPQNPSISMTLRNATTTMDFSYRIHDRNDGYKLDFSFEGSQSPTFKTKIEKYFYYLKEIFPFIDQLDINLKSSNTFPHSSGIASSASSMSALAMCLCDIERKHFGTLKSENDFIKKASYVSRIGSGSASRSVIGEWGLWGKTDEIDESSDEYSIFPKIKIHPVFDEMRDAILIVSSGQKSVSSSAGHNLMNNHPYANQRFHQARKNLKELLTALGEGDFFNFARIVEHEALSLHGMMMTSNPSYLLMNPNTLIIVEKIRQYFKQNNKNLCFTLDAGPNVHLLYSKTDEKEITEFIKNDLEHLCENSVWIEDMMGFGPEKLK